MAVKKAIAVIASENQAAVNIIYKLAAGNYRLLLVSKDKLPFTKLVSSLEKNYSNAELILQDCAKDGCWEADIIILAIEPHEAKEVAGMIREVAIQKIVIVVDVNRKNHEQIIAELKILLPHSKVTGSLNLSEKFFEKGDREDLKEVLEHLNSASLELENGNI